MGATQTPNELLSKLLEGGCLGETLLAGFLVDGRIVFRPPRTYYLDSKGGGGISGLGSTMWDEGFGFCVRDTGIGLMGSKAYSIGALIRPCPNESPVTSQSKQEPSRPKVSRSPTVLGFM